MVVVNCRLCIRGWREYVNVTSAAGEFFVTRGRRSLKPGLTAPFPERSLFTSTKSVCLSYLRLHYDYLYDKICLGRLHGQMDRQVSVACIVAFVNDK